MIYFISGHLDITEEEFNSHYVAMIDAALESGGHFVVGDARGADTMAQQYLFGKTNNVTVFHMFDSPRNDIGFPTVKGFVSDEERDAAMTFNSDRDIAWVREGREKSGTQKNLDRRINLTFAQDAV